MEYIAYGGVITNRLLYTDKTCIQDIMGGSGFYSFSALRLCTPKALLVAGVGPDFDEFYGKWMDHNLCSRAGLKVNMDKTTYNELVYAPDGTYVEYSIYGPEYEAKNAPKMKLPGEDLLPVLEDAKGICINVALEEHCADLLTEAKKKHPSKVMWEAPASAISELTAIYAGEGLDGLRRRLKGVDLFSTNKPESFEIFGVSTVEEAITLGGGHVGLLRGLRPAEKLHRGECGGGLQCASVWPLPQFAGRRSPGNDGPCGAHLPGYQEKNQVRIRKGAMYGQEGF